MPFGSELKGRADFTVVNSYTPAKCTTFQWLSEVGGGSRCLVTSDFNVRDSSWEKGFQYSSPTLTGQINDSNFIVLNDGSFTRIPDRSGQGQTAIDLTFTSADIADGVGWEVGEDSLSSDHRIQLCQRTGGSGERDRDHDTPTDHPRYGGTLPVGAITRQSLLQREG